MSQQLAQSLFLKGMKHDVEGTMRDINVYAFQFAGFREWLGDKEVRQYIKIDNQDVYAIVERSRTEGVKIVGWGGEHKKKKLNEPLIALAKDALEAAKAELMQLV